jgi:hypothetical protein
MSTPVVAHLLAAIAAYRARIEIEGDQSFLVDDDRVPHALQDQLRAARDDVIAVLTTPRTPVEKWIASFNTLDHATVPCPGFKDLEHWQKQRVVAFDFLGSAMRPSFAKLAHDLGWTNIELFGVHEKVGIVRLDYTGAVLISPRPWVTQVTTELIRFSDGLAVRRGQVSPDAIPIWRFGK